MTAPQLSRAPSPSVERELTFADIATPIVEHLGTMLIIVLAAGAIAGGMSFLADRRFRAEVSLAAVSSNRMPLAGSLPSALFGNLQSGLQASPQLVARLLQSRSLLVGIGRQASAKGGGQTIALRVSPDLSASVPDYKVYNAIRRIEQVSVDRETGLITVAVSHRDSALARELVSLLDSAANAMFRRASQSQAAELRRAQERRADSAASQLRRSEAALTEFHQRNRIISSYSAIALEEQRLQRVVTIAQTVYNQVVQDRESAISKELEDSRAVVVVDPVPRELAPEPRNSVRNAVLAALFAGVVSTLLFVTRDLLGPSPSGASGGPRLLEAMRRRRLLGLLVRPARKPHEG